MASTKTATKKAAPKKATTTSVGLQGSAAPKFNNRSYYEDMGAAPVAAQSAFQQQFGGNDTTQVNMPAYQAAVAPRSAADGLAGRLAGPSAAAAPSYNGLDDYGPAPSMPSYNAPKTYFDGWRPEFMDAFNAGRQEDQRRYGDLSGLSALAGSRYDEAKAYLMKGTPNKDEYLHGYDDLYKQFQGEYADRKKSADDLFREQLAAINGQMSGVMSSAASQYAAQQGRVDSSAAAAKGDINSAFQMAGGLADKYNGQGRQGVADAIGAAGQMTPEQQKLMQAYAAAAGSKAIDGLAEVGQNPSYGVLAQPFLSDAQLRQQAMTQQISDANAASQRGYQTALAGMLSDAYGGQQRNLNDILFGGGSMFTNMLNSRTGALSQYSNDYRGYADSLFNMGNETSKTQIDAMDRANQPSPYLQAMMKLTADAQQTDMGLRQADNQADFNGRVSMYNGDQGNRADIIKNRADNASADYASRLKFDADNYATDSENDWRKYGFDSDLAGTQYTADQRLYGDMYGSDQQLAGVLGAAGIKAGSDLSVAGIRAAAGAASGGGGGGWNGSMGSLRGAAGGGGTASQTGTITEQQQAKRLGMKGREWRDFLESSGRPNQAAAVDEVGAIVAGLKARGLDYDTNVSTSKSKSADGKVSTSELTSRKRTPNDILYEKALQTVLKQRPYLDPDIMRAHIKTVYMGGESYGTKNLKTTTQKKTTTAKRKVAVK